MVLVRKPGAFTRYRFREQMILLYLSSDFIEYLSRFLDGRVDFASYIALETADDVALTHSLSGSTSYVCLGPGVMRQPDEDHAIERGIGLTVATVKGGDKSGRVVSMVSENVRLSGQRKCHLNCSRWYQVTPF